MLSIKKGAEFYKSLFTSEGQGYWRHPKFWPIDVHNQAQGIITFSRLKDHVDGAQDYADKILSWTINNQQAEDGYYYYQNQRMFINKIPYMRLQAWMLYAMSGYL